MYSQRGFGPEQRRRRNIRQSHPELEAGSKCGCRRVFLRGPNRAGLTESHPTAQHDQPFLVHRKVRTTRNICSLNYTLDIFNFVVEEYEISERKCYLFDKGKFLII